MLEIKPIQKKEEQAAFCAICHIPYDEDTLAYAAFDNGEFVGMTQFDMEKECGVLKNLTLKDARNDFEAMFLLGRATLNFIDLCGVHRAICAPDAASPRMIAAIGFTQNAAGELFADLSHMFGGCGGEGKAVI